MPRRRHMKGESSLKDARTPLENKIIRCAIYTRKSTSEGLDQAFNSLDAQREAGEAYVASQKHAGWIALPNRYDDGGYSGGSIDRPALQKLLVDIEVGMIDCVVVYKVDRLSRSLMDFARIMKLFEDKGIHFVSVTQHFNTAESMGRLTLNILLSFAQFEREIIAERTRDKIAAARRRGQWSGGRPILGYDLDRAAHVLKVNEAEAKQVRNLFSLYLHHESLLAVVSEAQKQELTTKIWTTSNGQQFGGKPLDKTNLYYLLTNVGYIGKVRHKEEVFDGQHEAIVDRSQWDQVQALLTRNGKTRGSLLRNRHGALLKGLLRCAACNAAMVHSIANRGPRQYRYYICTHAQKNGRNTCPARSVKAHAIEHAVMERLKALLLNPKAMERLPWSEAKGLLSKTMQECSLTEQARLLRLVLDYVDYDGRNGRASLSLKEEAAAAVRNAS